MKDLIFLGFLIISIPLTIYLSVMSGIKKDKKIAERQSKEFIERESKLPKYRVRITTKSFSYFETEEFEPTAEVMCLLGYYICFLTSLESARKFIESVIKQGRYYDRYSDTYVPVGQISEMEVILSDGDSI